MSINTKFKEAVKKSNIGLALTLRYHKLREIYLSRLSDENFAKRAYAKAGKGSLDLNQPLTLDEKIWWLKLNYKDPIMTDCTDKVKVREYVKAKGLGHILNEIYGVYDKAEDIDYEKLPKEVFLKTNQSSATNLYITDTNKVKKKYVNRRMNLFMKKNHYALAREWNYKDIKPMIFSEKVIKSQKGLIDYKFFCSYGKVKGLTIGIGVTDSKGGRGTDSQRNVYDHNFNLMDVEFTRPRFDENKFSFPENIKEMKKYAEILSERFPFCRVDLYNNGGEIIFGELTFFPKGGINTIKPSEYKLILGSWIDLPLQESRFPF